ncbi:putative monovalent cation/H+ antiporter subunit A [soil metagenome]
MEIFLALLGPYLLAAVAAAALGVRAPRLAVATATAPHLIALAVLGSQASRVIGGERITASASWAPLLDLTLDLQLDGLGLVMSALVAFAGLLVVLYGAGYTGRGGKMGPMIGGLVAFAGAMQILVVADDLMTLFIGWELTSIASYGLISQTHHTRAARDAARQALVITGAGGLVLLAGLVVIGQSTGIWTLSGLADAGVPGGGFVETGVVLVAIAAATKSAQVPFATWLPGAMAAPTPVSAYLHSATMVKAGVFLLLRLSPALSETQTWTSTVTAFGCITLLTAGWRALQADDAKQLLAWSTVSQLGLLVTAIGVGGEAVMLGVLALVVAHALAKAGLFMAVGAVDVATGTRDLREIAGMWRRFPSLGIAIVACGASLAGLPPFAGFIAKEAVLEGLLRQGALGVWMAVAVAAGSALTVAYTARLLLAGLGRGDPQPDRKPTDPVRLKLLTWPAALLGVLTLFLGWFSGVQDAAAGAALASVSEVTETPHLYLWHGLTPALGLSAVAIASGVLLIRVLGSRHAVKLWPKPREDTFVIGMDGLISGARRLSSVTQSGSLPIYLTTIMALVIILPGIPLIAAAVTQGVTEHPGFTFGDLLLALAIAVGAVVTERTDRRFAAVLALGAIGFGIALVFVRWGAPDLALTQMLVETLTLMVFVLALRGLPARFGPEPSSLSASVRWIIAAGVGSLITTFALVTRSVRTAAPPAEGLIALAEPVGGGKNVVNVILTDFRALDTLGEITVLLVAAIGVSLLVSDVGRQLTESGGRIATGGDDTIARPLDPDVETEVEAIEPPEASEIDDPSDVVTGEDR